MKLPNWIFFNAFHIFILKMCEYFVNECLEIDAQYMYIDIFIYSQFRAQYMYIDIFIYLQFRAQYMIYVLLFWCLFRLLVFSLTVKVLKIKISNWKLKWYTTINNSFLIITFQGKVYLYIIFSDRNSFIDSEHANSCYHIYCM